MTKPDCSLSCDVSAVVEQRVLQMSLLKQVEMLSFVLGEGLVAGPAAQYWSFCARRQGYDIPPFPYAGCGEMKEFFADWGVKNVPEWYAKIGISEKDYEHINERTLVVVRNAENHRMAMLLDGEYHTQDKDFLPLYDSGVATKLGKERLEHLLKTVCDFLLRSETAGRPLF